MSKIYIDPKVLLQRLHSLLDAGDARSALELIERHGTSTVELKNAHGVCLLRLGQIERAVGLFRNLVVLEGTTTLEQGLPTAYKTNFATSLLLAQNVSGCIAVLDEILDDEDPGVIRLRNAVKNWKKKLTPFRRFLFNLYGNTKSQPVILDFAPGDLTDPTHVRPAA
ncbi:MAG: hypothetical protein ABIK28_18855 [Planctomycetota bacterium]